MPNNVKILLVDDNPMILGMLRGALTPHASVSTATDVADALLKAVEDPPDLLISDYRMPGMDGRQLVEKLRSRSTTAGVSVILLAAKADIREELDRLKTHVAAARALIDGGGAIGRRLDFLMQELNREANTLSSKSQDLETTRAAVEMKVIIEQMREQVQNVE